MPMLDKSAIVTKVNDLKTFWRPRNEAFKRWYRLIEMVDELATAKMESFVGNDPRAMYNLVLHLLDCKIPHRVINVDLYDPDEAEAATKLSDFLERSWKANNKRYRKSGPRQSLMRNMIGLLLATGWYTVCSMVSDDGQTTYIDPWNPAEVYPMWDYDMGLSELAHVYVIGSDAAWNMCNTHGWKAGKLTGKVVMKDYWWVDYMESVVYNAILVNDELVKCEPTRFKRIPVYVCPVGGLPDTGSLSDSNVSTSTNFGVGSTGDKWKEEIGQSIVATNEVIYKAWNKWWSFSMQILRDTAQPKILEKSNSGKIIVKPEDVFKRGAVFKMGLQDSVEFMQTPPIPLELRTTQMDLEAMMQRGGVSWAMYGNVQANLTAYVMSQIAASANQVIKPFHTALEDLIGDIDNDWVEDIKNRGVQPYGYKYDHSLPEEAEISAEYEVEIPGEMVQKATISRMVDPDFRLSYSYVLQRLWPDIKDPIKERARTRRDIAELDPSNALIALVQYYREQAAFLSQNGDNETAKLYDAAAATALANLNQGAAKVPPAVNQATRALPEAPQMVPPAGPGENAQTQI